MWIIVKISDEFIWFGNKSNWIHLDTSLLEHGEWEEQKMSIGLHAAEQTFSTFRDQSRNIFQK